MGFNTIAFEAEERKWVVEFGANEKFSEVMGCCRWVENGVGLFCGIVLVGWD